MTNSDCFNVSVFSLEYGLVILYYRFGFHVVKYSFAYVVRFNSSDSTVRKNDAKKKRLPLADSEIVASRSANQESAPPPSAPSVSESVTTAPVSEPAKAAPVKLLSAPEADSTSEQSLSR